MTKNEILEYFKDINHAYNDCTRYDTLKHMLDELQEPCDDAINREDALMALTGEYTDSPIEILSKAIKRINKLPPVTPQYTEAEIQKMQDLEFAEIQKAYEIGKAENPNKWIPVSERLPVLRGMSKISDDVLITNGFENDMGYLVERKGKIFWHYYGSEYEVGIKDEDNDAIAWMPLPEPYKQEAEDEN
jgi:hypothetical protein